MNQLLYLIGQPGAGKSTAMAALLAGTVAAPVDNCVAMTEHHHGNELAAAQLGKLRQRFPGTDTLPYDALPKVVNCLPALADSYPVLLGEGDRLANPKVWLAAQRAGYRVTVALLQLPDTAAAGRRAARGTSQHPSWIAGRVTRTHNLAQAWPVVPVDATRPPGEIATDLAGLLPAGPWGR